MNAYRKINVREKFTATIEDWTPIVGLELVPAKDILISVTSTLTTTPTKFQKKYKILFVGLCIFVSYIAIYSTVHTTYSTVQYG
jgi:hypothetical protein